MKRIIYLSVVTLALTFASVIAATYAAAQKSTDSDIPDAALAGASVTQRTAAASPARLFFARMNGANETPPNSTTGTGFGRVVLNDAETQITASFYWSGLSANATAGHIHCCGAVGVSAGVLFNMGPASATSGSKVDQTFAITPQQVSDLRAGLMYFNIHNANFPNGEIRGQLLPGRQDPSSDFSGDSKTDLGVIRNEGGNLVWYINSLATGTSADYRTQQFGIATDTPQAADYDGDGKADLAVWRPGPADTAAFMILRSRTNTLQIEPFGITGDDATIAGDYDGDGKADVAVYRAGTQASPQSYFFYRSSITGTGVTYNPWGTVGDVPVPGDYDGDGKADFVIKRGGGSQAQFWRNMTAGGVDIQAFGLPTDRVVPGDYDGDGKTDLAVVRKENGGLVWYYKPSGTPATAYISLGQWGLTGNADPTLDDILAQGDYDGDGKTDQAIFRPNADPNQNFFWVNRSTSGLLLYEWGTKGDKPTASYNNH